jgi:PPP family 3-phenylpropionic acid transporter
MLIASAAAALVFCLLTSYAWVVLLFILLSLFQSAITPVSDSLALSYAYKQNMQFGNLRLWGAIGFAISVFFTGKAVEAWGVNAIFFCYGGAFVLSTLFLRRIPDQGTEFGTNVFQGMRQLIRLPRFLLFLVSAFFIFGAINAHNIYFALYYQHIGGTVAGIGFAFLLFAGSEAPFMKAAGFFVRRWGLEMTILTAGLVCAIRWLWYGTAPSAAAVIALFFLQGISVGFYAASAAQFVRENTPASLQVTALAIFASFGQGLGSMTCNLFGGIIMDYAGILATYYFFGVITVLGLIPLLLIRFGPFRRTPAIQ